MTTADVVRSSIGNWDHGCFVQSTDKGREAFTLLNERHFDLCIVEYSLRDMAGVQLCSLLRHAGCRVPVMFFTNSVSEVEMQRAIDAGADAYLGKRVDTANFTKAIAGLLGIRSGDAAATNRVPVFAKAA